MNKNAMGACLPLAGAGEGARPARATAPIAR